MSWPRFSLIVIEKHVFGFTLQLETCGCKHFDLLVGTLLFRVDFGACRTNS